MVIRVTIIKVGFESVTFQMQGTEHTTEPPSSTVAPLSVDGHSLAILYG